MKIRTRAGLTTGFAVVVTLLAGGAVIWGVLDAQMERAEMAASEQAEAVLSAIESDIQRAASEIKTWSAVSDVTGVAERAATLPNQTVLGQWESQRYLQSDSAKFLRNLSLLSNRRFKEIFFTDARGFVVASTNPTSDFDQGPAEDPPHGEPWWRDAKANGFNIGELEYDQSSTFYSIDISVSLASEKAFVGVLKAVYGTDMMLEILNNATAGHGGHVLLVNADGDVVLAPSKLSATVGNAAMNAASLRAFDAEGTSTIESVPWDGLSLVTRVTAPARTYVNTAGWSAVAVVPMERALLPAAAHQRLGLIAAAALVAVLLAWIAATWLLGGQLGHRLEEIAQAALRVRQGRADVKIPHQDAGGELGLLAKVTQHMAARLKQYDAAYARQRRRLQATRNAANDQLGSRRRA
ncbi:cache domain-containing protein [uncultured Abyssibacter sp.]|uniref:cache domain-containing protein n=1 Tax=uncultured Abyssibacter sp. TaxID=2320202 RepID=UPI0032B30151